MDPVRRYALREEFRVIAMLLTVVTAANHGGHPTLMPSNGYSVNRPSLRSICDPKHNQFRNAVARILVRNDEAVVVTNMGRYLTQFVVMTQGRNQEYSVHDGEDSNEELNAYLTADQIKELKAVHTKRFATFTNADASDSKSDSNVQVRIGPDGKSHWQDITLTKTSDLFTKLK